MERGYNRYNIGKIIRNSILLLAGAAAAGVLLLALVYRIPVEGRMKDHAWQALEVFEREGFALKLWGEDMGSRLDNFTDALMVQTAVYPSEGNALEKGMAAGRLQKDQATPDPIPDLRNQLERGNGVETEYGRYWHGYLIWLKPLLYLFDYSQIRVLNGIVQVLLSAAVLWGMVRRGRSEFLYPFLVSWLGIAPWILPFSMQNSSIYNLTMFSVAVLLHYYDKIRRNIVCYFLLIGIGTSFFDLLTYPAVSFGIPFLFWMMLEEDDKSFLMTFRKMIVAGAAWGIGYAGFWSIKWLLGDLILHNGVVRDAIESVKIRSVGISEQSRHGYIKVCLRNMKRLMNPAFILAMCSYMAAAALCLIKQKKKEARDAVGRNAGYLLAVCIPFVWYLCTKNHADIHIHFTYRNLWISVLAGLCLLCKTSAGGILRKRQEEQRAAGK